MIRPIDVPLSYKISLDGEIDPEMTRTTQLDQRTLWEAQAVEVGRVGIVPSRLSSSVFGRTGRDSVK
jgi:hypothetical protein